MFLAAASLLIISAVAVWVIWVVFRDSRSRERAWEKKEQAWGLERQALLDRIMYLADRPWELPPSDETPDEPPPEPYEDPLQQPIESDELTYTLAGRV